MPNAATGRPICVPCLHQSFDVLSRSREVEIYRQIRIPRRQEEPGLAALIDAHFEGRETRELVTASRIFRGFTRVDLQRALDARLMDARCVGFSVQHLGQGLGFSDLLDRSPRAPRVAPLQYEEVESDSARPVRCLGHGLWLGDDGGERFAVVLGQSQFPIPGWRVEVAVPAGPSGQALVDGFFDELEAAVNESPSYRGKVLSLEAGGHHRGGHEAGLTVHRVPPIAREALILPPSTVELLERNVFRFVEQRRRLARLGMSSKKGLLFYGPPGTGKTHTIRHIATTLADHTTFLITAGEVVRIDKYMSLARLLSPSIVVIEDVDLIARERTTMRSPGEESLLNLLLNEMDGLKENTEILFILTTNRAEALEGALTSRPGRIDQAVEFPLPDDEGRASLVELYRGALEVAPEIRQEIVRRTERSSAAFIKELMRRIAQLTLERGEGEARATSPDVDFALQELLFGGGGLSAKLLGADARLGFG